MEGWCIGKQVYWEIGRLVNRGIRVRRKCPPGRVQLAGGAPREDIWVARCASHLVTHMFAGEASGQPEGLLGRGFGGGGMVFSGFLKLDDCCRD